MRDPGHRLSPLGFFAGARFALSGISFTFTHKRLLALSLLPMVVQFGLFATLLWFGYPLVLGALAWLTPAPGHWYSFAGALVAVFAGLGTFLVALMGTLLFGNVLCEPINDALSETTESLLLGRPPPDGNRRSVLLGIVDELVAIPWRLLLWGLVAVPLHLLSLTGFAAIVTVPLTLAWTFMFVALSGFSRPLARAGVSRPRRLWVVFSRPPVSLGFGAVGWLLSHVPLTSPFLVVGGTRLHLALAAHDRLRSSLSEHDKHVLRHALEAPAR